MTPEQVALVQGSLVELGPRTAEMAARFYDHLFEADPASRAMFSQDAAAQEFIFVSELAVIVRSATRFDTFLVRARDLGAEHARFGVTHVHYEVAGRALLSALDETLGPAFTDEMREAWRLAFDLVAEAMMQGGAEVTP